MSDLRQGWYWGTQAFREKLLAIADGVIRVKRSRGYRSAPVTRTHDEKEAERLVVEGLAELDLAEDKLEALPGSEPRKLKIAAKVRANTAVSMGWIAERLQMRSAANVSQQLRRLKS